MKGFRVFDCQIKIIDIQLKQQGPQNRALRKPCFIGLREEAEFEMEQTGNGQTSTTF